MCLTIPDPPHQVFYSYHDPRHCPSCRTCHLHAARQANTILQQESKIKVKQLKHPGFEFKPDQVNDSSQSNQGTEHLVSHGGTVAHFERGEEEAGNSVAHEAGGGVGF
jgi:hypothetical protein